MDQRSARPNMTKTGYKMIRWCWAESTEKPVTLISFGEHTSTESIKKAWQTEEMLTARNQFYRLFPDTKVTRKILNVIDE
jgi:hypothetical protein